MTMPKISKGSDTTTSLLGPVLIVTPWFRPMIGGVAEVAERLHRLLTKKGISTHLLVCDNGSSKKLIEGVSGYEHVWRIRIPSSIFYDLNLRNIAAMIIRGTSTSWHLLKFIRQHQIRSIIILFPVDHSWPFLILRRLTGARIIASYHGNDLTRYKGYSALLRWLTRRVLLTADAITVCAKHLAEEAQRIAGRELDIKLITNCVDIQYFLPAPEPAENRDHATLVHISNFNPKKKTTDIVEAFALAQISDSSRLVMVGNGPDYEATRELAKSLGIADRVNFAGAQKDVRPFLKEADLFVLASDDEGAPLVLLEAMASGLPWVSTPWGAAAILPPGECGLVVPANSPKKLAAAITELINDPERRFSMAKRGRQRAESDFSETTYVEEHCRVIREVEGK